MSSGKTGGTLCTPLREKVTRGYLKGIAGSIVIPLGHTELGMVEVDTGSRFIL